MKKIFTITILFIIILNQLMSFAAGPLIVDNGKTITYRNKPFVYRLDQGPLGKFSNFEATDLVKRLFSEWEGILTSTIRFQQDSVGYINFNVNEANYQSILDAPSPLGYSPIVFDENGALVDATLGQGASNNTLGFAAPSFVLKPAGSDTKEIIESLAVLNGKFIDNVNSSSNPESSLEVFKGTVLHEVGHAIGLGHSQLNVEALENGSSKEVQDSVPLMFPVQVNDLSIIRLDDISSISYLYPNTSQVAQYGMIEGRVLKQDGLTPVLGANVIARNLSNPLLNAISCVSDFLFNKSGSFTFATMPPGSYSIEIEPISMSFIGGSAVGPYATTPNDESFKNPPPKGYYAGENQPITTDMTMALIIQVGAGQTISNINIIASLTLSSSSGGSSGGTSSGCDPTELKRICDLRGCPSINLSTCSCEPANCGLASSSSSSSGSISNNLPFCVDKTITCRSGLPTCLIGLAECKTIDGTSYISGCVRDYAFFPREAFCTSDGQPPPPPGSSSGSLPPPSSSSGSLPPPNGVIMPICVDKVIQCSVGVPVCKDGSNDLAECRTINGVSYLPGCNKGYAFFPNDVKCVTSRTKRP